MAYSKKLYTQKTTLVQSERVKTLRRKAVAYEETKEDDYTNHFLSHFGFYDEAPDIDKLAARREAAKTVPFTGLE